MFPPLSSECHYPIRTGTFSNVQYNIRVFYLVIPALIPYQLAFPACHFFAESLYSQVPNKLMNFSIFFQPHDFIGTPRLLILRKLTALPAPHFISFLCYHYSCPIFKGKVDCFCIYFSSMLYDLFLFSPSLYNDLKPLLKFRAPRR